MRQVIKNQQDADALETAVKKAEAELSELRHRTDMDAVQRMEKINIKLAVVNALKRLQPNSQTAR